MKVKLDVNALQSTSVVGNFTTPYVHHQVPSSKLVICGISRTYVPTYRLTAVLISRFLLHLQSASLRAVNCVSSSQASSTHTDQSIIFERVLGSLGASIASDDYLEEEQDDWVENDDKAVEASSRVSPP